jgi:hypothetical protein
MATEPKKYVVSRMFTDKSGKVWNVGDAYTADSTETKKQVDAGNIEEDASTNS